MQGLLCSERRGGQEFICRATSPRDGEGNGPGREGHREVMELVGMGTHCARGQHRELITVANTLFPSPAASALTE